MKNVLFYDKELGIRIRNTEALSLVDHGAVEFDIYYSDGMFFILDVDKEGDKNPTFVDKYCDQLRLLGFDFSPATPRLLFPTAIEPSDETKLMLILKGVINVKA